MAKTQKRWKIIIEACGRLVKSRTWSLKFSTVSAKQGDTLLTHDPNVLPYDDHKKRSGLGVVPSCLTSWLTCGFQGIGAPRQNAGVFILRTGRFILESLIKGSLDFTVSSHGDCRGLRFPTLQIPIQGLNTKNPTGFLSLLKPRLRRHRYRGP